MWFATSDIDVGTFLAVHCLLRLYAPLKGGLRFVRQGVSASQVLDFTAAPGVESLLP